MTNRPRLHTSGTLAPGLLAVVLFVVMATIAWTTQFGEMSGYPDGIAITSEIGYAMFNLEALQSGEGAIGDTEPFLVAFILIAIVLDAALDASLVLAKREEGGEPVSPLASRSDDARPGTGGAVTDGGHEPTSSVGPSDGARDADGGESR